MSDDWTEAEMQWAAEHSGCPGDSECAYECWTYWCEEARRVLSLPVGPTKEGKQ